MSFDEIYSPGFDYDASQTAEVLDAYRNQIFVRRPTRSRERNGRPRADTPPAKPPPAERGSPLPMSGTAVPATTMGQLAWHHLVHGGCGRHCRALRVRHPRR